MFNFQYCSTPQPGLVDIIPILHYSDDAIEKVNMNLRLKKLHY